MFVTDYDEFGVRKEIELKPNGANIAVTEENKKEYVEYVQYFCFLLFLSHVAHCKTSHRLVAHSRLTRGTEAQTAAFISGSIFLFF